MPRLRVVLVEPQEAGNVGAVARVMKNFGFEELWIVGEHPRLEPLAGWWASGAEDVVKNARSVPTLHHAIGDAQITIATTSARARKTTIDSLPSDVAKQFSSLKDDETLALVFGREDRGLTREEVTQCQRTAGVSTNPDFPTMNLAQAVCVFCYALSIRPAEGGPHTDRANAMIIERLHERAESLLLEVGFLHANNPDRIYGDLRAIAGRADLNAREATILLGIIHQIEWKLRQ
ncbi:MAG: RNA methyltransferase [Acidobacteriota bacterium]|nr:RNA methyltransferase [Acidobacteriota bacterium]